MAYQAIFKRYELKYMLTRRQREALGREMEPYMKLDQYGHTTIRNIYFDTENFRLIRNSIERPAYKEKLRVRSYAQATDTSPVFVELKKKYDSVVYKRRIVMPEGQARHWLLDGTDRPEQTQIVREIEYFCDFYAPLQPTVYLSYEREAFYPIDGSDFRVTFDENILARSANLSLTAPVGGKSLLPDDLVLMELKTTGGIPLWMTHFLSKQHIYKTSFSKYGEAYKTMIFPKLQGGRIYA